MGTDNADNPDKTAHTPPSWRRLSALFADLPEVENARVERTARAIQDGSFRVDADRVAANLLAFERQRLKSG